jgi:hypothetical protein
MTTCALLKVSAFSQYTDLCFVQVSALSKLSTCYLVLTILSQMMETEKVLRMLVSGFITNRQTRQILGQLYLLTL